MIQGNNKLVFNQKQMCHILREWLGEHFFNTDELPEDLKVIKVEATSNTDEEFNVHLESDEEPKE